MALTKEDLQAIGELMDSKLEPINQRLDTVQGDIVELKSDVVEMKKDISRINGSVAVIEVEHGKKITSIYDGYKDVIRNTARIRPLEKKVQNHSDRIFVLEQVAKAN